MGMSWHDAEYQEMVEELRLFLNDETDLSRADVNDAVNGIVNILIDYGAVDPT